MRLEKGRMIKLVAVFTASVMVLIFIVGCAPVEPQPVKPPEVEPNMIEPIVVEPNVKEPNVLESIAIEPNEIEPNDIRTNIVEPQPRIVHDKCADILRNYVDDRGRVDYKTLRRRRRQLYRLLDEFAKLDPNEYKSWPKKDKIALWLNAYNIQLLRIIVSNYPIESSRLLHFWPGWGPNSINYIEKKIGGIRKQKFNVMDEEFTLEEIDQRFFRKEFDDPRILFALSYANLSSPPLRNEPYYGDKLQNQLDDQVRKFLSSWRAFKIDRKKKKVHLSTLFHPTLYGKEFISKYGTNKKFKDQQQPMRAVLNFITNYISEQDKSFLETENYTIKYLDYDPTLNGSN